MEACAPVSTIAPDFQHDAGPELYDAGVIDEKALVRMTMIASTALALITDAVALLGISGFLTRRGARLSRVTFAITVAIFSVIAMYCVVMLWHVDHWGQGTYERVNARHPRSGIDPG